MKFRQAFTCTLACLALALMPAMHVDAASVSGRSSTVVEWFNTASGDTAVPAFQYLQLNVRDMGTDGFNFYGYGRLGYDLADELSSSSSYADSRLYLAYVEKKGLMSDALDFRLGRQFISTTAGASVMDGLRLDYGFLENYNLTLFGGGDVTYYDGYSAKDLVLGTEISGRFFTSLDLGLSYVGKVDRGRLAQQLIGFDVEYDFDKKLFLYSETQYDYLSNRVSYFLAGTHYYLSPRWSGRLEYLYSLPVFSATNIYSVFAVDEYQELMGELTYNINLEQGWRSFARLTREIYTDYADANVFEAGVEKLRTDKYSGYLTGVYRDDKDGHDLYGFKLYLASRVLSSLQAGIGVDVDVLERTINYFDEDSSTSDTTSSRYWVDSTWFINDKMNLQGKVERIESDLWDHYNRGRVRLNVTF